MSQYRKLISNKYLGVSKEIKAKTIWELNTKVQQQRSQWKKREEKERQKEFISDMKKLAEIRTKEGIDEIDLHRTILRSGIENFVPFQWESLYSKEQFTEPLPQLANFIEKAEVPQEDKFIEFFLPSRKTKRLSLMEKAQMDFDVELSYYRNRELNFYREQEEKIREVELFKERVAASVPQAVEEYLSLVLASSSYPESNTKEFSVSCDPGGEIVVVDYWLPGSERIPNVKGFKYVQTRGELTSSKISKKDFDAFFEDVIYQMTLRTLYEVFQALPDSKVKTAVFNGFVHGVDAATGNDFQSCIVSVQVSKEEFQQINLSRVEPKACFRKLKGVSAGPLYNLAPVPPILQFNKEDPRFVESREVLAKENAVVNLYDMPWEDFEHLVAQLFGILFKERKAEVKSTRKSRDNGIDAVVFDEDPIFGGRYFI